MTDLPRVFSNTSSGLRLRSIKLDLRDMEYVAGALQKLEAGLRTKAIRSMIVAASKPIKDAQKRLAPRAFYYAGYNDIVLAIGHRSLSKTAAARAGAPADADVAVLVGVTRSRGRSRISAGRKAIWHEYGTKWRKSVTAHQPPRRYPVGQTKDPERAFLREGFRQAAPQFRGSIFRRLRLILNREFKRGKVKGRVIPTPI